MTGWAGLGGAEALETALPGSSYHVAACHAHMAKFAFAAPDPDEPAAASEDAILGPAIARRRWPRFGALAAPPLHVSRPAVAGSPQDAALPSPAVSTAAVGAPPAQAAFAVGDVKDGDEVRWLSASTPDCAACDAAAAVRARPSRSVAALAAPMHDPLTSFFKLPLSVRPCPRPPLTPPPPPADTS